MRQEQEDQSCDQVIVEQWYGMFWVLFELFLCLLSWLFCSVKQTGGFLLWILLLVVHLFESFWVPVAEFDYWWDCG